MVIDQTMSDFDQAEYQAKTLLELSHIIQTKKIPNALLFYGNESTGRKEAAFFFARGCNCLSGEIPACNQCLSCRKINSESHPDILTITPLKEKKVITISQIRELGRNIASKPNEARFRMVLITQADRMNVQAQNAMLKMLEEPPDRTCFILTASTPSHLLSTIGSRCRKIRFRPLTDKQIEQYLIHNHNVERNLAYVASRTADADLTKAKQYVNLADDPDEVDWIKRRSWLIKSLISMIKADPGTCISKGLILSQQLSSEPDLVDDTLAIVRTFLRDLMIFKLHPKKIVNLDFFDTFADINQIVPARHFAEWLKFLHETEIKRSANSTLRLTLDNFFLKMVMHKGKLIYD